MTDNLKQNTHRRYSGILMPIFSLPSKHGIGSLGQAAYDFCDFLKAAGQRYWQILPLGVTGYGNSPYQSASIYAGNPYFIDLDLLVEEKLLTKEAVDVYKFCDNPEIIDYGALWAHRREVLRWAYDTFLFAASEDLRNEFKDFCHNEAYWLDDFALYTAIKVAEDHKSWLEWPEKLKMREPKALSNFIAADKEDKNQIEFNKFVQFLFFRQWYALKDHANKAGLKIIGDIPLYPAEDSAETWADSSIYLGDEERKPLLLAGYPPDAFSSDGQFWGNPVYDWQGMQKDNYKWWCKRLEFSFELYDILRLDHFLGLVNYWAIPAGSDSASEGEWRKGPGRALFDACAEYLATAPEKLPLIVENLGRITEDAEALLEELDLPGMAVLQFAFDSNPSNSYLPHNVKENCFYYPGTHDNDNFIRFYRESPAQIKEDMKIYLGLNHEEGIQRSMIRSLFTSKAENVIIPAFDLFAIDNVRLNTPATSFGNWKSRISADKLKDQATADYLKKITLLSGRFNHIVENKESNIAENRQKN